MAVGKRRDRGRRTPGASMRSRPRQATAGVSRVGQVVEVEVGPVAHGGHCVARHEGRVIFVRHALPGERVSAVITEGRDPDAFWRADAIDVVRAAPDRVAPRCEFSGAGGCGGCDWQHVSLEGQRSLKAAVVIEQMHRMADLDVSGLVVEPVGEPDDLRWRTRVQFAVDADGRPGLRKHRSHDVVPVDVCAIAHQDVTSVEVTSLRWPGASSVEVIASGTGEQLVIVAPDDALASADGAGRPRRLRLPTLAPHVSVLQAEGDALQQIRGRTRVTEQAAGRTWRVTGSGFWQVHPGAADALSDAVLQALAPQPGESALDLYCGVGLFAGVLAGAVGPRGEVVAVEADPQATADARRNLHEFEQISIVTASVADYLAAPAAAPPVTDAGDPAAVTIEPSVDLVVLDPTRSGAGESVCVAIAALTPRAIAYVACDPAALARDVATFAEHGYELSNLRAFDLFPLTHHVECLALLAPRLTV